MCTFRKDIQIFESKVDVQKKPLKFGGKLTIDVLVSSNISYFIQMACVLGSYYYDSYYYLGCTEVGNKVH